MALKILRQFTPITVSNEAKVLPGLAGSGWVRDLQEAATLSPQLAALFESAKTANTRADFRTAVAALLHEWGGKSSSYSKCQQASRC